MSTQTFVVPMSMATSTVCSAMTHSDHCRGSIPFNPSSLAAIAAS
jgi:hypothetical protein